MASSLQYVMSNLVACFLGSTRVATIYSDDLEYSHRQPGPRFTAIFQNLIIIVRPQKIVVSVDEIRMDSINSKAQTLVFLLGYHSNLHFYLEQGW